MLYLLSLLGGFSSPPSRSLAETGHGFSSQPMDFLCMAQGMWAGRRGDLCSREPILLADAPPALNGTGFVAPPALSLKITQLKLARKIYAFQ